MIAVIADDFTGAAEIGGIGLRHGLNVIIETEPIRNRLADLIIIATDTRSLRADEASRQITQITEHLLQFNPKFIFKKIDSVLRGNIKEELLAQMIIEGIRAVGRMGEIIAQASSELRADQQRTWEQRQEVQDKIAQNFSDYIRGVDRFKDPLADKEVELPAGYGHAWANNLGEHIVTDSPSYNPNIGSNLHWEQLKPVK